MHARRSGRYRVGATVQRDRSCFSACSVATNVDSGGWAR
jgi:hypothetical protein